MNLDAKLKWKEHIKKKKEEVNIKYRQLYWFLGRNSELSTENKIRIYNQILKSQFGRMAFKFGDAAKKQMLNKSKHFRIRYYEVLSTLFGTFVTMICIVIYELS